jgi:hypothetical protein
MNPQCEERACLLRKALIGNALFSTLSGLTIILANHWVVRMLGLSEKVNLVILGVILIFFAASLVINARRPHVKTSDAWIAVWMDLVWVLGSYVLIFVVPFSMGGKWIVGVVAELVLAFAVLQILGIRKMGKSEQFG